MSAIVTPERTTWVRQEHAQRSTIVVFRRERKSVHSTFERWAETGRDDSPRLPHSRVYSIMWASRIEGRQPGSCKFSTECLNPPLRASYGCVHRKIRRREVSVLNWPCGGERGMLVKIVAHTGRGVHRPVGAPTVCHFATSLDKKMYPKTPNVCKKQK
jgi:hypothetical protein